MERSTKQVDAKPSNWKNKLSPGFAEEESFYSLLILGIFYVIYAAVKVNFDAQENSVDDEERFIQSCYCSFNQRFFLRFWFSLCCVLWFIAHTYGFLSIISIKRFTKFGDIIKVFLAFLIICPCYCIKSFCTSKERQGSYKVANYENKETLERLNNNVRRLWFQYCKLYVVGYTEYDDSTDSITKQTKKQQSEYYQSKQRKMEKIAVLLTIRKGKMEKNTVLLTMNNMNVFVATTRCFAAKRTRYALVKSSTTCTH